MKTIHISKINSEGITHEAKKAGLSTVEMFGEFEHPDHPGSRDWTIRIYFVGDACVADTNGDPVWEAADPAAFAALLKEYGVEVDE